MRDTSYLGIALEQNPMMMSTYALTLLRIKSGLRYIYIYNSHFTVLVTTTEARRKAKKQSKKKKKVQ